MGEATRVRENRNLQTTIFANYPHERPPEFAKTATPADKGFRELRSMGEATRVRENRNLQTTIFANCAVARCRERRRGAALQRRVAPVSCAGIQCDRAFTEG